MTTRRLLRLPRLLGLMALALSLPAWAGPPSQPAPEPPAMPAAKGALAVYQSLDEATRSAVDGGKVLTFGERHTTVGDHTELLCESVGVLQDSPESVKALLANVEDYPTWLTLQPSYKTVRVVGADRVSCEIGAPESPKPKRTLVYQVAQSGETTTWSVVDSTTPLHDDSHLSFEVVPHPTIAGACIVLHQQLGLLPASGRMVKYLESDDSKGQNRWWKDSMRHARRVHWAFDAAVRHPPGQERKATYIEHFQREFNGELPWWATN